MNETDKMASQFADNINCSPEFSFETNVNIYAMHSVAGVLRWGESSYQNQSVCPILGELYLMILNDNIEDNTENINKFAPLLINSYKGINLCKKRAEFLIDEASELVGDNDMANKWFEEAKTKMQLKEGLLEDKHLNAVFKGNQYIFVVYAFIEILKEIKNKDAWTILQQVIEVNEK